MMKLTRDSAEPLLPHIRPSTKNRIRKYLYILTVLIAVFFVYRWLNKESINSTMGRNGDMTSAEVSYRVIVPQPAAPEQNTVKLDIYMESQCPDTSRFFRQQLRKMWDILGDSNRIDLTIIPFGKARCTERGDDFQCQCQHGATECEINQLMNCVIDRIGFPHKYISTVLCMQGKYSVDSALKCAQEILPAEVDRLRECANGKRGRRLLALSGQKTAALTPAIDFIPWIVIDGIRNSDALYDLTQNVCESMKPRPTKCKDYLASLQKR